MSTMHASLRVRGCAITFVTIAAILFSVPASAQTLYGTLVGNVTDETGLAVPGATVKVTHTETGQTREGHDERDGRLQLSQHSHRHVSGGRRRSPASSPPARAASA